MQSRHNIELSQARHRGGCVAGTQRAWVPLFALLLSGCAALGLSSGDTDEAVTEAPVAKELVALIDFMSLARNGEAAELEDPSSGSTVRVVAGRRYQSASGKLCRRFAVTTPPGYAGFKEGLACQDDAGHWKVSNVIVNPEDLARPR